VSTAARSCASWTSEGKPGPWFTSLFSIPAVVLTSTDFTFFWIHNEFFRVLIMDDVEIVTSYAFISVVSSAS
jgi:hypothetical protein